MSRSCLAAVRLVKDGTWTPDDVEKWLQAVITNDKGYCDVARDEVENHIHPPLNYEK